MHQRLSKATNRDVDRILEQMERAFDSDAWHGPSVRETLRGLRAHYAFERLIPGAHTIWEIVLHLEGWKLEVIRRLEGHPAGMPSKGDWPDVLDNTDASWQVARQRLAAAQAQLLEAVTRFPAWRLDEVVRDDRPLAEKLASIPVVSSPVKTPSGNVEAISDDFLDSGARRNPTLGTGVSFFTMLLGAVQHDVYHAGQIALLKKRIK